MTGAAFQARASLNLQATDPTSHTPVESHSIPFLRLCHLHKSHGRPLFSQGNYLELKGVEIGSEPLRLDSP